MGLIPFVHNPYHVDGLEGLKDPLRVEPIMHRDFFRAIKRRYTLK